MTHDPIDKDRYQKSLDRLTAIYSQMAEHAEKQSLQRCPYKNRHNKCTAHFGCRYKRKPQAPGEPPACTSDDRLDYRTAWETDPDAYVQIKADLEASSKNRQQKMNETTQVSHGGETCAAAKGSTIFDCADELAVRVPTSCFRSGICHECVVEIQQGMDALSPRSDAESFLQDGYRLACQAVIEKTDEPIEFSLLRRAPKILTSRPSATVDLDPMVIRRGNDVYYGDEKIDTYRGRMGGLAIDVGTTTVVAELIDLESGDMVYEIAFENPQRFGGSDVMHRISYDAGEHQGELHRAIINTLNTEVEAMCQTLGIERHVIYEIVVAGNSTMRELFFNLDVQSIGQKPYKSVTENEYLDGQRDSTAVVKLARLLRIRANRQARTYGIPLIASHVGADTAAALIAIGIADQSKVVMLVDAGTNTEVVIGHKGKLLAASCPAGPAFEGGGVTHGMAGGDGAIESVRYDAGTWRCKTIGEVPPAGMCGSGLIDLLAELRRHDLMTPKGVFADKAREFTIVPESNITFSRADASELAQAKAANYCGQMMLMRCFGVGPGDITKLYLAGGFANYVDAQAAIDIGFLAPVLPQRIIKAGNAAAQGARELLLSCRKRQVIDELVKSIEHVELETMPDFFEMFVEGCQFKPMEL